MNTIIKVIFSLVFVLVCGFTLQNMHNIKKIESYLTHNHGYDAKKALGYYKAVE